MSKKIVEVYPHYVFEEECKIDKLDDTNVEENKDWAFIDIVGTDECQKYFLKEEMPHYFKENHSNVLNLEFDDLEMDYEWNGHVFKPLSDKQAEELVEFIENNLGRNFRVCCRAGISRSQAVGVFLCDMYPDYFWPHNEQHGLFRDHINQDVLRKLKRVFYAKHLDFKENN